MLSLHRWYARCSELSQRPAERIQPTKYSDSMTDAATDFQKGIGASVDESPSPNAIGRLISMTWDRRPW